MSLLAADNKKPSTPPARPFIDDHTGHLLWGKYRDYDIHAIDPSYLQWVLDECELSDDDYDVVMTALGYRR